MEVGSVITPFFVISPTFMTFKVSNILYIDPEDERITKKGFLTKQGGFVPTWKRRWYVHYECVSVLFLFLSQTGLFWTI